MNAVVNLATIAGFLCAVIVGIMLMIWQDLRNHRPQALIRARVAALFPEAASDATASSEVRAIIKGHVLGRSDEAHVVIRWFRARRDRLRTVAPRGMPVVIAGGVVALGVALAFPRFTPVPTILQVGLALALPVFTMQRIYQMFVDRFRERFLAALPDAIDMIVRAVRAGVPVVQVLPVVARDAPQPLAGEFERIGDSLQVGMDLEEVLTVAVQRVHVADFSFFCVCLLLQRETGGQLGETLENLAGIVRARREIRQKTKALTAETRITVKILAAIPVLIMLTLYVANRDYVMVLFTTPTGRSILTFAVTAIISGVAVINRIANLDTSR
ncbi:type II secretion system F family protein [Paraburkholderia lycopersici]|uniref:Flp pilus assembly protein TadB n=1 Tax=Paraburkholderia lycopersici TaxID=416944 RepID=A0A1G6VZX0_9BURK|nr:type II secretion system F family protein [Paraburkholderia lycopersici]SDD59260.1 Flp pilus assembly protein TadB [Paraburkholderia lycopersici]